MWVAGQISDEKYLPLLRHIYVHVVNRPEPWRAVRWGSKELQSRRFEVLAELVRGNDSVLDVGCGRGEFIEYLDESNAYLGIDLIPEFIPASKIIYPERDFETHDLRDEPRPANVVVASGTFTISSDKIFWSMLDAMWESAGRMMAFNCKSTWAPDDCVSVGGIGYVRDPAETLAGCRERYTRKLKLDCSYLDHDFTIAAFK